MNWPLRIGRISLNNEEKNSSHDTESGNPFVKYFDEKLCRIKKRLENNVKHFNGGDANRSYCPQFVIFIMKYLKEMPLWSGVLLGRLDRYQEDSSRNKKETRDPVNTFLSFSSANAKSEGYIEGAMRNLKQEDFAGRKDLDLMHLYQKIILESEGVYVIMLTDYIVVFVPRQRERTKRNQTTKMATFQAQLRASVQKKRSTMMLKKNGVRKIQKHQSEIQDSGNSNNRRPYHLVQLQI